MILWPVFVLGERREEEKSLLVPASRAGKSKPYCELGKLLDTLAHDRDVRGPYNIAGYVQNATGYKVSGQAISKYLYGHSQPKGEFVEAFADAFRLTPQERAELAWSYTYGFQLPWDRVLGAQAPDSSLHRH